MNRGVWLGVALLGLWGLSAGLHAQEAVWRPARRPAPVTARGSSGLLPSASLGRPVAVSRGVADEQAPPGMFPPAYRTASQLSSPPESSGVEPIATVPPPGAVIAASSPAALSALRPPPDAEEPAAGDLFASDRREQPKVFWGLPSIPPGKAAPEIVQVGNWTEKHPLTPPDPAAPPPPDSPFLVPGSAPCFYLGAEYLLWWARRDHTPPLATTGDPQLGAAAGRLGNADTVVLFGGALDRNPMSGVRFTAGVYCDDRACNAIEVTGFFLPQASDRFSASSAQFPVLARPFFSLNEGIERVQFVALPGSSTGTLRINAPSEVWGMQANMTCKWCSGCDYRLDLLGGFRFLSLREQLEVIEDIQTLPGLPDPFNNTHVLVRDSFATNNQFYGGQVGASYQKTIDRFTLGATGILAMGVTHQELTIQGSQQFPPGTPNVDTRPGGLLALNSNIGRFARDRFAVVPELTLTAGYFLTENVQVTLGYNFLYWSSVVRPGDQIDRNLDVTRIPNFTLRTPVPAVPGAPGAHPGVLFKDTDYWLQGLTVGLRFTF
jgi:hypothetical protein